MKNIDPLSRLLLILSTLDHFERKVGREATPDEVDSIIAALYQEKEQVTTQEERDRQELEELIKKLADQKRIPE